MKRKNLSSRHSASVVVEMILTFPILLMVAFGVIEFGQFLYVTHCFQSATRDAARIAIMSNSTQSQVTSVLTSTLHQANVTYNSAWLTITDLGPSQTGTVSNVATVPMGDELQVTLSATYSTIPCVVRPLSSWSGVGISSSKLVVGETTMIKE